MKPWQPLHHKFRKWTTPVHILAGLTIAYVSLYSIWAALGLFAAFGFYEHWEAENIHNRGWKDFWEAMTAAFIGFGILTTLRLKGII